MVFSVPGDETDSSIACFFCGGDHALTTLSRKAARAGHFATSVEGLRYLEGSYDRHLVWERLSAENITFGRGGRAPALVGCGLGVTIEPARLDWVTQRKEKLIG